MVDQFEITRESYPYAIGTLASAARPLLAIADSLDLAKLRQICGEMEALAPVMEPTAYARGGMDNLRDQAAFLRAAEAFVTEVRKLDRTRLALDGVDRKPREA